jgi:hypothetical protein
VAAAHRNDGSVRADLLRGYGARGRRARAELEIDATACRLDVLPASFSQESELNVRRPIQDGQRELRGDRGDQRIVALDREHPDERGEVERSSRLEQEARSLDQRADLAADRERVWCRNHGATRAHEDVIPHRLPDARQRTAHGGRGQVQPLSRAGDAVVFEERLEREEEIHLRVVQADVRDPLSVQRALGEGAVVLSGLGVTQRDDAGVLTAGARVLLIAARPARVVWLGAYGSGRSAPAAGWPTRLLLKLMGDRLADKVSADEAILQYGGTVFHAGLLSNHARSETRQTFALDAAPRRLLPARVSRATVAAAMLDEAEAPRFAGGIAVPID